MKSKYFNLFYVLIAMFSIVAVVSLSCKKSEKDLAGELGTVPEASFTVTPMPGKTNTYLLNATTTPSGFIYKWDIGDGSGSRIGLASDTAYFPEKGTYTVKLMVLGQGGYTEAASQTITVTANDPNGCFGPKQLLTNCSSKTWVIDRYNNFTKEVATATGYNVRGHMGLGPLGSYSQEWWATGPNDKNMWTMYDYKFTFFKEGSKLNIITKGEGYGRMASSASVGGFTVTGNDGDDAYFAYNGGDYTYAISPGGKHPKMTLSGNAFMGYYLGTQVYEIIYLTEKVLALRIANTIENHDWIFVYTLPEFNVAPPPVIKPLRAVPLSDNFESGTPSLTYVSEDMGDKSGVVDNPAPLPINISNKVYRYQKTTAFYTNLSFVASGYKFDLSKQNKIRIKVFIPSYNDYTTQNDVAGPWISNTQLQPQLAIKLQNSEMGGDAWQTQTEIVKGGLEKDKWLELVFDFSGVADRQDYDKIVIQFGAEGHTGTGFFFFDDFSFEE